MSRAGKDQSDLGISLKDMATILQTGKKLTRGAKNQLKVSTIQRQQGEKHSEMSFDSRKSIDTRKDNRKNDNKQIRKKDIGRASVSHELPYYLGVPDLQKYLHSHTLEIQTSYTISRYNIMELGKNYFPSLIRVLLKNNLIRDIYEVKRGELKRQKTTREQFLIEFQHPTANRNEVRSITRENGIVLIGQNLAIMRIGFQQWKTLFAQELKEIKPRLHNSEQKLEVQLLAHNSAEHNINEECKEQDGIQHNNASQQLHYCHQKIQQQQSLEFVHIIPDPSREQFTLHHQPKCNQVNFQSEGQQLNASKIEQEQIKDNNNNYNKMIPEGEQQPHIGLTEEEIFRRFCLSDKEQFMLWPVVVYDLGLGDEHELQGVIDSGRYTFSEKDRSRLFETIANSKGGLYGNDTNTNKQRQKLISRFQTKILPKLQQHRLQNSTNNLNTTSITSESQLNLIISPIGLNKLINFNNINHSLDLYPLNIFQKQQFLTSMIFSTYMRECVQQLCYSINRMNEFTQLQVTQTKSQDIRSSIDRLVKCQIQNKIYNAIVLRYSNLQKKMLLMVFNHQNSNIHTNNRRDNEVKNEVKWVGMEQVYCNYTLPQLSAKSKFLLYDTNQLQPKHPTLVELFNAIYAQYLYNNFTITNAITNTFQSPNNQTSLSNTSSIAQASLPSITRPSIPNRCTTCFYPIHRLPHYKCLFCDHYSHQECSQKTINKSIQLNNPNSTNLWTCDHCQPCVVCLQPLKNLTISCSKCHTNLHQICGKLKLQQNLIRDKYSCENCIQCKICQKKLKNLDYVLIKNGYQCINCYKAQQANQICHICKKQSDGRWAQCSRQFCGKWIHKNCDKYIQTRNNFFSTNNQQVYYCPFCRCIEKRRLVLKFIDIISIFDEYQYFISSDYEDILDYKYVVANPMCFRKMTQRCYEGCYDMDTLNEVRRDFDLIVSNALKYNMPKDQPHYQARILNVLSQFAFQKFRQQLQCTQEQIIRGGLMQRMLQKKKQLYKQVYEHYLQIILNYGAKWSSVEVKRPKQSIKALQKVSSTSQLTQFQQHGFNSRLLLKQVFRSAMIKFKLKKKPATIQNLFETQKVIQAYKSNINSNYCYYHYWNTNTKYYCHQCMEYYCCVDRCYRHQICRFCGVKGCACDVYQCGCGVLKEKERKLYQKLLIEKFYDRREITQNYKLCLKCAFQKLNTKQCTYCLKSYEFYYDFETCLQCKKIYHKQCADEHASQSLSKFFFKHPMKPNQSQLFSTTLRLNEHCYQCSINKGNKLQMFEKLRRESLQKLSKIQKLCKYQVLIISILFQNGIKLSLCDVLGLIMDNYQQFLLYEGIFQQYRMNYAAVKLTSRLNMKVRERFERVVKQEVIENSNDRLERQLQQRLLSNMESKDRLIMPNNIRYMSPLSLGESILINMQQLHRIKSHIAQTSSLINQQILFSVTNQIQSLSFSSQTVVEMLLQRFQQLKARGKINWLVVGSEVELYNVVIGGGMVQKDHVGKKANGNNGSGNENKHTVRGGNSNVNGQNHNSKSQNGNTKHNSIQAISPHLSNTLLYNILHSHPLFNSFEQLQLKSITQKRQQTIFHCKRVHLLVSNTRILNEEITIGMRLPATLNDIVYELHPQLQSSNGDRIINDEEQQQQPQRQQKQQKQQQHPIPINHPQQQFNINDITDIDIQQTLQRLVNQSYNKTITKQTTLSRQLNIIHSTKVNSSKLSKLAHLSQIHSTITKFILKCFQYSKTVHRRGNTCLLRTEKDHWRVLKKYSTQYLTQYNNQTNPNQANNIIYEITLKKQSQKWFFSINQNTWWVQTIQQIIQKLRSIIHLTNFRQLADFLGFTFRLVPSQKANHFSKFLRTHPLDKLSAKDKKKLVVELYDRFEWAKNGCCKNRIVGNNTEGDNEEQEILREQAKEYTTTKRSMFYLSRRKKPQYEDNQLSTQKQRPHHPYITYQDMKRDLQQAPCHPSLQRRKQLQPKQYIIPQSRVFIGPSPIHKLGLFAKQNYPKLTPMIEYIGEIVSEATADVRQAVFHFGCYMFGLNRRNVDRREIIDATFRGNMARYLNHSCDPNCKAKIQLINNQPKIFIYSIRDIKQFQQLTYDYQFSVDADEKLTCTCGAKNCQGRLN